MSVEKTSTKKYLSATVYYLLIAFVFSWIAFFNLGVVLPLWQSGITVTPQSLAVIHTVILGFMLTVAFGVFYQFVPIAFQSPAIGRHVLYWHLPLHCLSVASMIVGFWQMKMQMVAAGGTLLLCSTLAYLILVYNSYSKAKNQTIVHKGLTVPLSILLFVMLFGIWIALGLPGAGEHLLLIHVFLGSFVFWMSLVMVISYKFIPMFTLSHGYKISQKTTLLMYFAGLAILLIAVILYGLINQTVTDILTTVGSLIGIASLVRFTIDMMKIIRARKRKSIVFPIRYSLLALGILIITGILMFVQILFNWFDLLGFIAYTMVFAGFIPLILSYTQKIIPFLWFEYRFSHRPERKQAPLIDDMVSKVKAKWSMIVYFVGIVLGMLGFLPSGILFATHSFIVKIVDPAAGLLCMFASLLLFTAFVKVLTIGGPRPLD